MWIMIVMSGMFGEFKYPYGTTGASASMIAIEFSSKERCISAAEFTRKQAKVYNAFCVQK